MKSFMTAGWTKAVAFALMAALGFSLATVSAYAESPTGCNADNSVVNISSDVLVAEVGETITFTVSAGNAASVDGCDITGRTMTLILPNGAPTVFGPFNYPNPTPLAIVGSVPYIANAGDLVGGLWTANVTWNGTLKAVSDLPSTGSKNISVNEVSDLVVTKTAVPDRRIAYQWTIDKSVTPAAWDLFNGDSGTSEYTIALTKSVGTETNTVSGVITITNPNNAESATITGVSDVISGVGAVTVNCPVSFPHVLPAGGVLVCSYSSVLPDSTTRTNTATVTTSGLIDGGSGQASIDFSNVVPTTVNGTVNVDDTFAAGDAGPFSDSTSYKYSRTFACGADEGIHNNTATIVETQQSDSASVTVNCHELAVTKDATTTFTRTYDWDVEKSADQTSLTLAAGEHFLVNYSVVASVVGSVDSAWMVTGNIAVNNPAPIAATINSVNDIISGPLAGVVNCGVSFPYTLAANGVLNCTYSANLPDGTSRLNTATATQQNYDYDKDLVAIPDGTTDETGTANVTFGAPSSVIDEQVSVVDPLGGGILGTATVAESPKTFNYSYDVFFDGEGACGEHRVDNTATITTNDTQTEDSDTNSIPVTIECPQGCTLTQGYWKTHSILGPAAHPDDNWASVGGPNAQFFTSGMTWIQVFNTPPKGNAWYNLAHQYMAAKLNVNNGASVPPSVASAIASAEALFGNALYNTPAEFAALGKKSSVRTDAINWAGILGSFNEGQIGPGHCDE